MTRFEHSGQNLGLHPRGTYDFFDALVAMLIEFGDAFDYTGADFREWCTEVGFRRFEFIPLAGPTSAAVAYK